MSTWNYQKNNGLPVSWKSTPLNYLFTIIGGNGFAPELQGESYGELPFIKNSDISSGASKISTAVNYVSHDLTQKEGFNVVPKNSILMGKIGESMKKNRRVLNTVECCIDNNMQAMVPTVESIHPEYGLYALQLLDAADFDNGGPVPSINNIKWRRARIPLPQKREQILIMAVLNSETAKIDRAIDLLQQELDTLDQLKKSMIHEAVTKGLDPTVPMKPSGVEWIGDIPEHWSITRLSTKVTKVGSGKTPLGGADTYVDEGIPLIRSQNIFDGELHLDDAVRIDASTELGMHSTRVRSGDVLLNITGASIGRSCVVPGGVGVANVNQHVCIIRPDQSQILPLFLHYLWSTVGQEWVFQNQNGATREALTFQEIRSAIFPIPDLPTQQHIVTQVQEQLAKLNLIQSSKEEQLRILNQQRASLIFEYVTGKRRVSEVE